MPYRDSAVREANIKQNKMRTINRRRDMLSVFACRACGLNEPDVIQWHHLDPSTKEFDVWRTAWSEEKFWNEILKCIPLCANCHVKIHKEKLCLLTKLQAISKQV